MSFKKSTVLKILNKEYTVNFPSVGQQLEIESLKILLSNGTYKKLAEIDSDTANRLLNSIDAYSIFSVMIPELDLKPEDYKDVDPVYNQALVLAFINYDKFMREVRKEINDIIISGNSK